MDSKHYLEVTINGVKGPVVLDTGCDRTVIPPRVAQGREVRPTRSRLFGVGGRDVPLIGTAALEVRIGETRRMIDCLVSPAAEETFLGLDWLRASEAEWSFGQSSVTVGGCRYPLLTSRGVGRPRKEARVGACRVFEPLVMPLMSIEFEKKFVMPPWMEPPRRWRRPTTKNDEESCNATSTTPEVVTESRETEHVSKSDPPVEPTPSVTEALGSPREMTETSSGVDESDSIAESTPSVTEVQETLEEAAVKLMRVATDERDQRVEQEWEMPDWFQRRMAASAARHAQRGGMRFGMWGIPLKPRAQESTC